METLTAVIFVLYLFSAVVNLGRAITIKDKETKTVSNTEYYFRFVETVILTLWLIRIMQLLNYL